jgi:fermentation-respiration switch protein FrsA (DUF1100 family)
MTIFRFLVTGILIYAFLVGLIWMFQERIAFPAPRRKLPAPERVGVPAGERISVVTEDGIRLFGWYLHPEPSLETGPAPAIIWFYGNFETAGVMAPTIRQLRPPGWGVLILDLRGYGESEGVANESGFYLDAEAAWDYLAARPDVDMDRIVVFGRSLGTGIALHLAVNKPVAGVILEAPFTSGRDLARTVYWWLPGFVVRIQMDNLSRARSSDAPLLVLHGSDDTIVPVEMGRAVAEAGQARSFEVFEGAGHNEMLLGDPDRYTRLWNDFLRSVVDGQESRD